MNKSIEPAASDSTGEEDTPLPDDSVSGSQGGHIWDVFDEWVGATVRP